MVEGPARSAGGSSLAPTIARREAAGALAYSMTPVNRSPNSRANWGMAADHLGIARFQEAVKFMMASQISFLAASSLGNRVRVLITFRTARLSPSIELIV